MELKVVEADWSELSSGSWLVLFNAHQTPPHLGILSNGQYYSLTFEEVTLAAAVGSVQRLVETKALPTLFVGLHVSANEIDASFAKYERAIPGEITCLHPIKDWLSSNCDLQLDAIQFVFELIPILFAANVLGKATHVHLTSYLNRNQFTLRTYTLQDIYQRIHTLQQKQTVRV